MQGRLSDRRGENRRWEIGGEEKTYEKVLGELVKVFLRGGRVTKALAHRFAVGFQARADGGHVDDAAVLGHDGEEGVTHLMGF